MKEELKKFEKKIHDIIQCLHNFHLWESFDFPLNENHMSSEKAKEILGDVINEAILLKIMRNGYKAKIPIKGQESRNCCVCLWHKNGFFYVLLREIKYDFHFTFKDKNFYTKTIDQMKKW